MVHWVHKKKKYEIYTQNMVKSHCLNLRGIRYIFVIFYRYVVCTANYYLILTIQLTYIVKQLHRTRRYYCVQIFHKSDFLV